MSAMVVTSSVMMSVRAKPFSMLNRAMSGCVSQRVYYTRISFGEIEPKEPIGHLFNIGRQRRSSAGVDSFFRDETESCVRGLFLGEFFKCHKHL